MHNIITTLQRDHHHFQSLIEVVQQQINAFKKSESSDCLWLVDGMQLIRQYLELLHQPVENVFLERLLSKSAQGYDLLSVFLNGDHFRFMEHCTRFIDALEKVLQGSISTRTQCARYGDAAIYNLYRQIAFEERAVFPYANQLFKIDDWISLDQDIQRWKQSSIIENRLRSDYQNLIRRLPISEH